MSDETISTLLVECSPAVERPGRGAGGAEGSGMPEKARAEGARDVGEAQGHFLPTLEVTVVCARSLLSIPSIAEQIFPLC